MGLLNEQIEHQVLQELLRSRELSSQRIAVEADHGQVTLNGEVQTFRQKLAAQQVAESNEGVSKVENQLVVRNTESTTDLQLTQNINHQFQSAPQLSEQTIRVDSRSGIVTLSGYVSSAAEKKIAADIAASVDSVRDITSLIVVNPDRVIANREHAISISAALKRIIGMENDALIVSVIDETARISGAVDSMWKKEVAEKTVRQFGILTVCNEIAVRSN